MFLYINVRKFMWGQGPTFFTEQGPIEFKSGPVVQKQIGISMPLWPRLKWRQNSVGSGREFHSIVLHAIVVFVSFPSDSLNLLSVVRQTADRFLSFCVKNFDSKANRHVARVYVRLSSCLECRPSPEIERDRITSLKSSIIVQRQQEFMTMSPNWALHTCTV